MITVAKALPRKRCEVAALRSLTPAVVCRSSGPRLSNRQIGVAGGSGVDASRRRARRATTALIAIACLAALAGLIQLGVWAASRDQLKTGPKRDAPRSSPLAVVISPTQHPLTVDKSRRTLTHLHGNGS